MLPEIVTNEAERIFQVDGVRYASVTQILKEMGFLSNPFYTEQGAENGTRRHKVIELFDNDNLAGCDEDDLVYLQGWKKFREDKNVTIISIENRLYNTTYRYTGKPDRVIGINGKLSVLDIKTGSPAPHEKYQIGGYLGLFGNIFAGCCVYLQDNGNYRLSEVWGRKEREAFFNIVTTYHLREETRNGH